MHRPDLHGYDPETRLCMAGDIATRYIGTANDLLMEIVASGFEVVHAEVTDDFDDVNDMLLALATRP